MLKKLLVASSFVVATFSAIVFAIDSQQPAVESTSKAPKNSKSLELQSIKYRLEKQLGMAIDEVVATPLTDVYLLVTERGTIYASRDGNYVIQGKVYDLSGDRAVDVADVALAQYRIDGMARFENDMIVYPAKDEKHVVTVFTDITCGYCRKMHKEMQGYNDLGITVRYLAYPRSGVTDRTGSLSQGFKDLRSIWCHEDPVSALTKAKNGSNVQLRICDKPIEAEFEFGRKIGVSGTPAIILADGNLLSGYRPPAALLDAIENR